MARMMLLLHVLVFFGSGVCGEVTDPEGGLSRSVYHDKDVSTELAKGGGVARGVAGGVDVIVGVSVGNGDVLPTTAVAVSETTSRAAVVDESGEAAPPPSRRALGAPRGSAISNRVGSRLNKLYGEGHSAAEGVPEVRTPGYVSAAMDRVCDNWGCKALAEVNPDLSDAPGVAAVQNAGGAIAGRLQNVHDRAVGGLTYPGAARMRINDRVAQLEQNVARYWDLSLGDYEGGHEGGDEDSHGGGGHGGGSGGHDEYNEVGWH